ncbi:MAG TPA: hypothetical protein VMU22_09940 [Rhizomicrobium sp.]|nr:hypothetical protein [Rhizomicrobium sp.]
MGDVVKLPSGLSRFSKRFVNYAKVGICLALILFLVQSVASGLGAPSVLSLAFRAGILLVLAIGGAAGVALAHELRKGRRDKDNRHAWRNQVPW